MVSMAETREVAKRPPTPIAMGDRGLRLTSLEDAYRFAQYVLASGVAPKGFTTAEQVLIAMQAGAELGFSPMRALSSVTVINGRAGLMGEAAIAKIHESGVCTVPPVIRHEGAGDDRRGVVSFQRKDSPERIECSFSVADAKRAGLWGKNGTWSLYPDDMLEWRAVARMCKRYFGDVLMGLVVAEELRDYPAEVVAIRNLTPPADADPLLAVPVAEVIESVLVPELQQSAPKTCADHGAFDGLFCPTCTAA